MHQLNLKIIKIILVILTITVVLNMVGGIKILKNNYYWRGEFFKMQYAYLKTKIKFAKYNKGNNSFNDSADSANNAKSIPVLLYHGVIADPDWQPDEVNVRLADFEEQMFKLKKAGWRTIKLEDYLAFIRGEKNLSEKSFLLTFDDGRSDSFYPVDPILRTFDYSAVMFVITGRSLDPEVKMGNFHLSKIELEKMLESGRWQMASHTKNGHGWEIIGPNGQTGHFLSNKLWLEKKNRWETENEYENRIHKDLLESKEDLEKNLNIEVLAFAYPFGDFGDTTENFPESRGVMLDEVRKIYPLSFCQTASGDFPFNYQEKSFLAKRIDIDSFVDTDEIMNIFESSKDKPVEYSDDFSKNNGWIRSWGDMEISGNSMLIKNSLTEEGGAAFLNGSYLWKDYYAKAKVKLTKNGKASLAVRYHDGNNYMSCDFSRENVSLTKKINKIQVSETFMPNNAGLTENQEFEIGARVKGNNIECYLNKQLVVSGIINSNLSNGGVSFKIWDPVEKDSALIVKDFNVTNEKL